MTDANLYSADLEVAVLTNAILPSTDLNGANMTKADLNEAKLTDAKYDSKTTWPTAEYWNNMTCPDVTNSDNNPSCGF